MTPSPEKTPSVKLAWAVSWSAFWTGFPLKLIVALLLLAAGINPWEGGGLIALLLVSIPIDIWALGLTARTVFLERLGLDIDAPVGFTLWWQGAVLGGLVLGISSYAVSGAVDVGKKVAAGIIGLIKKVFPHFPIAEQITVELLLWTIPVTILALVLLLIWLKLFGWCIKRLIASSGTTSSASYFERVRQWDSARVPDDVGLMITSFGAAMVLVTIAFWMVLPVTTPHPHQDYQMPEVSKPAKPMKPEDALKKTENSLAKAEAILASLEDAKSKESKKPERKGK